MESWLILGIVWTVYGLLGLAGLQFLPGQYRGYEWTSLYIRKRGISNLLFGIPCLLLYGLSRFVEINYLVFVGVLILFAIPSFIYSIAIDRRYCSKIDKR